MLTPVTIATAIALGNIFSQTTQDDAARAAYLDQLKADVVVTSDFGGLPDAAIERIVGLGGVTGASELVTSSGWLEKPFDGAHTSDPLPLIGISAASGRKIYTGNVRSGTLERLTPGTVALPHKLAEDLDIDLGDRVVARLGDGARVEATVVATVDQPGGYEQLVLPARDLAAHTTAGLTTSLLLRGGDTDALAGRVSRELPDARVGGPELLREQFDAGAGVQAWINYLIAVLALAYAALATINTLAVTILDRRREFGLQRLTGGTRREVARMLYREVVLVGAAGYLAGAAISVFSIWPIAIASGRLLPSGPLWILAASLAILAMLLLPVTAICARIAMRRPAVLAATGPGN